MDKYAVEEISDLIHLLDKDLVEYVKFEFSQAKMGGSCDIEVEYQPHKETKTDFGVTKVESHTRNLSGHAQKGELYDFIEEVTECARLKAHKVPDFKGDRFHAEWVPGDADILNKHLFERIETWMN